MKHKLKWRVAPVPTGRFCSFEGRGWPSADVGERIMVDLDCEDEYVPAKVRVGDHKPIKVLVAEWYKKEERGDRAAFEWRTLKKRAATLKEAKALAQDFVNRHPEYLGDEA